MKKMTTDAHLPYVLSILLILAALVKKLVRFEIVSIEEIKRYEQNEDTETDNLLIDCPLCGFPSEIVAILYEVQGINQVLKSYMLNCVTASHDPVVLIGHASRAD